MENTLFKTKDDYIAIYKSFPSKSQIVVWLEEIKEFCERHESLT